MSFIKLIHILAAMISISGFILRGIWIIKNSPRLQQRWVRIVPHVNDTILLIAGVMLAISIQQYPFVHGWLTAKILALLTYIGLGMVAIRHGHSKQLRIVIWFAAILVFAYIVGVARTRQVFILF